MTKKRTPIAMAERASARRAKVNSTREALSLTKRQREVLDFIKVHIQRFSFPPTIKEIAEAFGFGSFNAAYQHVLAIEKKGAIKRDANYARAITVIS